MARAYLGLGSNQGDRVALVNAALERLQASGRVRVIKRSSFYETAPVGVTDQPRFVNLVAEVHTDLGPQDLLELALAVERTLGRVRTERWGPRTVDIDILLYDGVQVDTPTLVIPHPEMIRRRFVLEPLLEIAPDAALPDGRRLAAFLPEVRSQDVQKVAGGGCVRAWCTGRPGPGSGRCCRMGDRWGAYSSRWRDRSALGRQRWPGCWLRRFARRRCWKSWRRIRFSTTSIRTCGATPSRHRSSSFSAGTASRRLSAGRGSRGSRSSATTCLPKTASLPR